MLLVLQPFPVLHDYPEWMYQGHIAWSLASGEPAFAGTYELVPVPVPNAISHAAIALLNSVVTPVMAGKIWLVVYVFLALLVAVIGTREHRLKGAARLLFLLTIAFGPGFFNGYINFQFGVLFFALFVVANARRSVAALFLFSLLIYFSHASVFAGFVIYIVVSELFDQRRVAVFGALLPSMLMLCWYSVIKMQQDGHFNTSIGSVFEWLQYKVYTLAKQGPFHNFIQPDGQSLLADAHGIYLAGFAINFLIAVLIGCWFLSIAWAAFRRSDLSISGKKSHNSAGDKSLSVTVCILLFMWLLAGVNTFGVVNLGERFLIVVLVLLLLKLDMPAWLSNIWSVCCVAAGIATVVSLVILSNNTQSYAVARSADSNELASFVDDIYSNSRHKYFNHRLFIYANLGQYLMDPDQFDGPLPVDHESSIVRMRQGESF